MVYQAFCSKIASALQATANNDWSFDISYIIFIEALSYVSIDHLADCCFLNGSAYSPSGHSYLNTET